MNVFQILGLCKVKMTSLIPLIEEAERQGNTSLYQALQGEYSGYEVIAMEILKDAENYINKENTE